MWRAGGEGAQLLPQTQFLFLLMVVGVWHWGGLSQDDFAFVICQPDGATFATVALLGESPRLCHRAPVGPGDSLLSQGHPQPHLNTDPASPSLNTRAFPCLDSVCLSWAFWVTEGSSEMGGGGALQDINRVSCLPPLCGEISPAICSLLWDESCFCGGEKTRSTSHPSPVPGHRRTAPGSPEKHSNALSSTQSPFLPQALVGLSTGITSPPSSGWEAAAVDFVDASHIHPRGSEGVWRVMGCII